MKLLLKNIIFKIRCYWRLFLNRMPQLRNATLLVLAISICFYFIRFKEPLSLKVSDSFKKLEFIQLKNINQMDILPSSLELFDTAPLFLPTRWNYGTNLHNRNRSNVDEGFASFDPIINLNDFLNIVDLMNTQNDNKKVMHLDLDFVDMRLLSSWMAFNANENISNNLLNDEQNDVYNSFYKVEIITTENSATENSHFYRYQLSTNSFKENINPFVVLINNNSLLSLSPIIYEYSLSDSFDTAILNWIKNPKNLNHLPKDYLKLTFFPN